MKEKEMIKGIPKEKVMAHLEKYKKMALDGGAAEVRLIPRSMVIQTVRAAYNCSFMTACPGSGTCYFCPPQFPVTVKIARAIAKEYEYILFTKTRRPVEALMGPDPLGGLKCQIDLLGKNWPPEIVDYWLDFSEKHKTTWRHPNYAIAIEKEARKDGYHFAMACKGGSCNLKECAPWGATCPFRTGPVCRFAGASRPDGAAGMFTDFPRIVRQFGWQQTVGGFSSMLPQDIPKEYLDTYLYGLIFIV